MYLSPSNFNKRNYEVAEVQRMLNAIRVNFHHSWNYLTEDGIYGKQSAEVVRQFQIYKGVTSQMTKDGPILGDTTVQYIREAYNYVPQICEIHEMVVTDSVSPQYKIGDITMDITNGIMSCLKTFDDFLRKEIIFVNSQRPSNPNALKQRFISLATRMDPTMKTLKKHLSDCFNESKLFEHPNKKARRSRKKLVSQLKEFDIITKIDTKVANFLKSKGISGEIKVGIKHSKTIVKFSGGGLLLIWSLKDLIIDLLKVTEWGKEEWKADLKKHFYEFLDGFILGYASTVIAELIVGGIIAVAGVTISAGWVVVIIAIAALLISLLFDYLMSEAEVSFSQKAIEGYGEIISLVKF